MGMNRKIVRMLDQKFQSALIGSKRTRKRYDKQAVKMLVGIRISKKDAKFILKNYKR